MVTVSPRVPPTSRSALTSTPLFSVAAAGGLYVEPEGYRFFDFTIVVFVAVVMVPPRGCSFKTVFVREVERVGQGFGLLFDVGVGALRSRAGGVILSTMISPAGNNPMYANILLARQNSHPLIARERGFGSVLILLPALGAVGQECPRVWLLSVKRMRSYGNRRLCTGSYAPGVCCCLRCWRFTKTISVVPAHTDTATGGRRR